MEDDKISFSWYTNFDSVCDLTDDMNNGGSSRPPGLLFPRLFGRGVANSHDGGRKIAAAVFSVPSLTSRNGD